MLCVGEALGFVCCVSVCECVCACVPSANFIA